MSDKARAGVEFTPEMTDVQRAIAIVESSRQTHVQWRRWASAHPDDPEVAVVGDAVWHAECIANYDEVLDLLRLFDDPDRMADRIVPHLVARLETPALRELALRLHLTS